MKDIRMYKFFIALFLVIWGNGSHAQQWLDLPTSSPGDTRYQIKPSTMFSVHDDTPQRTLHYGVEIRLLSQNGSVKQKQTVAFKASDCNKTLGVVYIEKDNKSQSSQSFNKSEDEPYGKVVLVVCNVTKELLN